MGANSAARNTLHWVELFNLFLFDFFSLECYYFTLLSAFAVVVWVYSVEELIRVEVCSHGKRGKNVYHLQSIFHILLPISFILRIFTHLYYSSTSKALLNQTPTEIMLSAMANYVLIACFICCVSLWMMAFHAKSARSLPKRRHIFIPITLSCVIIPFIFFISLYVIYNRGEDDQPKAYDVVHTIEALYAAVLNLAVSIVFLVYGFPIPIFLYTLYL